MEEVAAVAAVVVVVAAAVAGAIQGRSPLLLLLQWFSTVRSHGL